MYAIFSPSSATPYLGNSCKYILDNLTLETGVSLYNIFENRIFHQTVINPEFSHHAENLQTAFSYVSATWVLYDIQTVVRHLIKEGSFKQCMTVLAVIAAITYTANEIFNWWFRYEGIQNLLIDELPEKIKKKIDVSLIRPAAESLQILYIARIVLNGFLAYSTPHAIPYLINVLCQMHTLHTAAFKTRWLKFSRTFSYLTKQECLQRLSALSPYQEQVANYLLLENFNGLPEEIFEELLDEVRQIPTPI